MGEAKKDDLRVGFDSRLKLKFSAGVQSALVSLLKMIYIGPARQNGILSFEQKGSRHGSLSSVPHSDPTRFQY